MPDESVQEVGAYLEKFFGNEEGKIYLASLKNGERDSFKQYFLPWPLDRKRAAQAPVILANQGADVFFCPTLFDKDAPKPERQYAKSVNSHWLDFDGNAPSDWQSFAKEKGIPEPSMVLQSSVPGHEHAYWFVPRVSGDEALDKHENVTRNLTALCGTDKSGWDLPQLLRLPHTFNYGFKPSATGGEHKPWYSGEPVKVAIVLDNGVEHASDVFAEISQAERQILSRIEIKSLPPITEVLAFGNWSSPMLELFQMTKQEASDASPNHRSGSLQRLAYYGAEQSFTDEQIYSILNDADTRWEKYTTRSKAGRDKILRDTIARARAKIGYLTGGDLTLAGIMSHVSDTPAIPKFVYNYEEFLAAEFHVDWLLDGLIAERGLGILVGQPGVGKTRMGLQMGLELAAGRERVLAWNNTNGPKKVAVLSLEMGGNPLSLFMQGFKEHYEKDSLALSRNFFIAPVGTELPLDRPEGQAVISNFLADIKPDILMIDSLQKSISTAMTDELAIKAFTKFLGELRNKYNVAIYLIHHERKLQAGTFSSGLSDVYGSQMLNAELDFAVGLSRSGTYTIINEYKNRLAEEKHDIHMKSDGIRFALTDMTGDSLGSFGKPPSENGGSLSF